MRKNTFTLVFLLLLLLSISLTLFHSVNKQNSLNWHIYTIWLFIFLSSCVLSLTRVPKKFFGRFISNIRADWQIIVFIFAVAFATRMLFLTAYPYVTLGDELRDAGWHGLSFGKEFIPDVFGFGSYNGYGNFIPLISYYFSLIWGNTSLIYILPSALVGMLSIILTYFVGRVLGGKFIGIAASLFLAASYVHLHYSRTELLVVMDSLLSLLIFIGVIVVTRVKYGYLLAGLVMGFALHFYAGTRGMVFTAGLFIMLLETINFIKILKKGTNLLRILGNVFLPVFLLGCGILIGLGPRVNYFIRDNLVFKAGTLKSIGSDPEFLNKTFIDKLGYLTGSYQKAMLTYLAEPVFAHTGPYKSMLLSFPVNWFFVIGFISMILGAKKNRHKTVFLIWVILVWTVTNQVFINAYSSDHRFLGILPFLAVTAAYGVGQLKSAFSLNNRFVYIILAVIVVPNVVNYFSQRPSDQPFNRQDYIFQDISYQLKNPAKSITYIVQPSNQPDRFSVEAYEIKALFYAYPYSVYIINREALSSKLSENAPELSDVRIYALEALPELSGRRERIMRRTCGYNKRVVPDYKCPPDFQGELTYYVYD